LHLHSGNILINEKNQTIKISELENFISDLPIKNEQYFFYLYDELNYENNNLNNNPYSKNIKDSYKNVENNNMDIFNDIFKNQFNIFEKIDIISFGRVLYEMTTGKELKAPYPDELEYKDMDIEIAQILRTIFQRKNSKLNYNNNNNNLNKFTEISAKDLLKLNFFKIENSSSNLDENNKENLLNEEKLYKENDENGKLFY